MSRAPEKSDGAFRTIREVADWLGVPTHVLRFWESKFEHVSPVKGAGGRRYYRPEDMRLLGGIKVLLHDQGQTIRGVAQKIVDEGVEPVMALAPSLDGPEAAQRTRRVIREGDRDVARDGGRVVPFGRPPAAPVDEAQPDVPADLDAAPGPAPGEVPEPAPAPVPPEMPDAPPQPDALPEEPDVAERAPADVSVAPQPEDVSSPEDGIAPPQPVDPAETDGEGGPPQPQDPSEIEGDAGPPQPVDLPDEALEPAPAPEPFEADPPAPPPVDAVAEPAPRPIREVAPTAAALMLVRGAAGCRDPRRLRRIARRLRGLAEEIAEDIDA
ncbi:MerR family transcriptional regulator [Jannaschia sp. W003]|uniref:MerR family transcriptional regulator n=1 Tax=Jannaschia sp. W003 TaxID=2867012 RepID=UPI0021A698EA|nr:MerR family transcriptional regulator [Jannaschia sp. W003]UWQ20702.1 MerR family transcriptional regulator [Jannaschia sp. W003]